MNDADKKKLQNAIAIVDSLQGQLSNIAKRGPNAAKAWAADLLNAPPENKPKLKNVITASVKLVKDSKAAGKDLESLYKEGTDPKKLAAHADGKAFRAKTAKLLTSSRGLYDAGGLMEAELMGIIGSGMYPGMSNVDVKAFIGSVQAFNNYFNAIRIELAKL